ncbi:MAG: LysE family translocator [Cytophagales bacterium]|nr:LysE family translocator [Cytophagales bacterium]
MGTFEAITKGLAAGMILTIMIGPVFFALLQNSLEKGYKAAFHMTIGISISDAFYITICYFGIAQFAKDQRFQLWLGIIGGCIMLALGLLSLLKSTTKRPPRNGNNKSSGFIRQMLKGMVINGLNPSVLIFWLGIVSVATVNYQFKQQGLLFFFGTIILTVFITDNLKAYLSDKLSPVITTRFIRIMNSVVGIAFLIFSIKLFHFAYNIGFENLF